MPASQPVRFAATCQRTGPRRLEPRVRRWSVLPVPLAFWKSCGARSGAAAPAAASPWPLAKMDAPSTIARSCVVLVFSVLDVRNAGARGGSAAASPLPLGSTDLSLHFLHRTFLAGPE